MKRATGTSIFRQTGLHVVAVLLLGLLAYSNTLNGPFLFDDKHNISENSIIKDLKYFVSPSQAEGFAQYRNLRTRFVGYLTFALNCRFHGLDVRGFHIVNLAIHLLAALAVYLLVRLTFLTPRLEGSKLKSLSPYIGLAAALLFVSHPIQTQAVTYIVQRLASLTALFYLSVIAAYSGARLSKSKGVRVGLYLLALVLTVLAMKTKENAFTLPLALGLYEIVFFRSSAGERARRLAPFMLTLAIIPISFLGAGGHGGDIISRAEEVTTIQNIPRAHYLMTEFRVLLTYLRLLLVPVDQNLYYDYPVYSSFFNPNVFLSFIALVGLFVAGIYLIVRPGKDEPAFRIAGFGILWFFLTNAVESTLIPLYVIFEHRMYLPSAGLFITTAVLVAFAYERFGRFRKAIVVGMLVIPVMLAGATYSRNRVWQGDIPFWQDVISKAPSNSAAYTNLANAYKELGDAENSIKNLQRALELNPNNDVAHNQLGLLLEAKGNEDDAVREYLRALEISPEFVAARNNLGKVYLNQGRYGAAIEQYEQSLSTRPDNPIALSNLGYIYSIQGDFDRALELFRQAIKFDPGLVGAYLHMGSTYAKQNKLPEAAEAFSKALDIEPSNADAQFNLANSYMRMGDFEKAAEGFSHLAKRNPDDPDVFFALGAAWFNAGSFDKAIPPLKRAIGLKPQTVRPYVVLARAYLNKGDHEEAKSTFERLLQVDPGNPVAIRGLKELGAR